MLLLMFSVDSYVNHTPTTLGPSILVACWMVQRMLWSAHRIASKACDVPGGWRDL